MFTIDGTAGTSSSNTVTTAIQGVTLNLTAAAIGVPAGTPQTLTVAQDTTSASTAINNFVNLYNTLVTTYGQVAGFDSSKAKGAQGGPLLGNSMFNTVKGTLASIVSGGVKNGSSNISLGAIGIALNKDGTLTAVDQCIRRWRPFRTPTSTHITPNTNLGHLPPRSHPVLAILGISVRSCSPLGPLTQPCPSLGSGAFRYRNPTNLSPSHRHDDLLSGRSHVSSCLRSHRL